MASNVDDVTTICPFEGPEKLLEIWFAPSPENVPDATTAEKGQSGLRAVERKVWEDMLDIVKCKVLSVIYGEEMDAYLLRYVSNFILVIFSFIYLVNHKNFLVTNRPYSSHLTA